MHSFLESIKSINSFDGAIELLYSKTKKSDLLDKTLKYSQKKHLHQYRKSGEEYIVHPILVASICAYFGAQEEVLIAALLHDVIEDTETTIDEIETNFSVDIAHLVMGLTKISKIVQSEATINSAMSFEKMIVASTDDVRVLVIKLCDRLHNLLTLSHLKEEKQKRIANESLKVYASIAHKLGMHRIKNQLEDLSFKFLFPKEFENIDNYITKNAQELELKLNIFVQKVETLLLQNGFILNSFKIEKRVKHYYSIFLKMQRSRVNIDEVLDIFAIRLIVNEPNKCYLALGILHQHFKPLFGRFKDYIALPKENGYQTIHTTLFSQSDIIEVQIRTNEMNQSAKYGIAAHWLYKSTALAPDTSWINRLKENTKDNGIEKYYELCKNELYIEEVQIFTPEGKIITLPRGSCGIDFAYAIHSDIGNKTSKVYVNNIQVPILSLLESGDIVKVETSDNCIIRCTWINQVKTSKAKKEILKLCKQRAKLIDKKLSIKLICNILDLSEKETLILLNKENLINKIGVMSNDFEFLKSSITRLKKYLSLVKRVSKKINIKKYDSLEIASTKKVKNISIAQCCNPKLGDTISATKNGSNIIIHNKLCPKFNENLENSKIVFVKWSDEKRYRYKLIVSLEDKIGSLASLLNFFTKNKVNLISMSHDSTDTIKHNYFEITIETKQNNIEHFREKIYQKYKIIEFISVLDAFNQK